MIYNASSRSESAFGDKKMALTGNLNSYHFGKRAIAEPVQIQYKRTGRDAD